ncbi:MAG: DUF4175 family protein, partial [Beijerinckiaceae bacterium]
MATTLGNRPQRDPDEMLGDKISSARRVITWERIWPAFAAPVGVIALFLAVSWFGMWLEVPRWARAAGVVIFALAFLWSLRGFLKLRAATADDGRARLDRDSGVPHRPVQTVSDNLAMASDEQSRALWALHQKRAAQAIEKLKVASPDPAMRRIDPRALRFAPL